MLFDYMKKILFLVVLLLVLPGVLAMDLVVEKISKGEVMVSGIDKPAVFDFEITNEGADGSFKFSNLLAFEMQPEDWVLIKKGETKQVQLEIYPRENLDYIGYYKFEYFILESVGGKITDKLVFEIIELGDGLEIGASNFDEKKNSFDVYIENTRNFNFGEIDVVFSSAFFDLEKKVELGFKERKEFEVELNKEEFKKLMAGFYTLDAEIEVGGKKADISGIIDFKEKDSLLTEEENYGFFVDTKIIKKINDGNVLQDAEVYVEKNIFSRLFTSFSPEPDIVDREGFTVSYTWKKILNPDEVLEVAVKTNWLFPLLLIIFIVVVVGFVKQYSMTNVVLRKKVTFVKAKGGEFALKVSIFVKARKYVEKVTVVDRLPGLVKLYEKFGIERPQKIDEKNRKIEWGFEKLEAGEVRILSYIVYSKVGVLGKFALPSATAFYEKDGEIKEASSNKAFFVAEPVDERRD